MDGNVIKTATSALNERLKELTCLYKVLKLAAEGQDNLGSILQGIANILPLAWQYPEIADGRVVLDGTAWATEGFVIDGPHQQAQILINGERRGTIDVVYHQACPLAHEGPFLKEERHLIDALATEIASIVERHEARQQRLAYDDQLRHADRLATIGQLAAGVVHELNEPLSNILGFAQLALKGDDVPSSTARDIEQIVSASLHARQIVEKLRLFARPSPTKRELVSMNDIVNDGLYFTESRCKRLGITIYRCLAPGLPKIEADAGQLHQVLTNLTINAVQAMDCGGELTIKTSVEDSMVVLSVSDTGCGMDETTIDKVFLPFFTTKDVDEGTGLGLSVVDGIIKAHGGTIAVSSEPGVGTCFRVSLPIVD